MKDIFNTARELHTGVQQFAPATFALPPSIMQKKVVSLCLLAL